MGYQPLQRKCPRLRLVLVPRKPERFDEVLRTVTDEAECALRRSRPSEIVGNAPEKIWGREHAEDDPRHRRRLRRRTVIVGDTMGELRKFYSLADFVIVGRTFVDLGEKQHGSDMIEPAALGKPVIVGPYTGNFAEPMRAFLAAGAIRQITATSPQQIIKELVEVLDGWLRDPAAAAEMGRRARDVVLASRGATHRHVAAILRHLGSRAATESTARERHQVAS